MDGSSNDSDECSGETLGLKICCEGQVWLAERTAMINQDEATRNVYDRFVINVFELCVAHSSVQRV